MICGLGLPAGAMIGPCPDADSDVCGLRLVVPLVFLIPVPALSDVPAVIEEDWLKPFWPVADRDVAALKELGPALFFLPVSGRVTLMARLVVPECDSAAPSMNTGSTQ